MSVDDGANRFTVEEEARARLAAIVDSSDDAIISKTLDGVVTSWNRGAEKLYGYPASEAVGRPISFIVPTSRREELQRITDRVKRGERVEHLETVRLSKDGRLVYVSLTISPILDEHGSIVGVSTIGRDIAQRMQMEQAVRESETRYRTLVEMARDAVVVHQEGRFVYANCAALGLFGARSLEQLQQHSLLDLVHPEEREAVQKRLQQLLEGEEIPLRIYRLLRLDGGEICVEASSTLIDYQGKASVHLIARDITERKRAEQEREDMQRDLAFERSRFETVVRQLPIGVMIAEAPSGRLLYYNAEAERIIRLDFQELLGGRDFTQWQLFGNDGTPLRFEEYPMARALKGESVNGEEYRISRGDGTQGVVSINAAPIVDPAGRILSGVATFTDVAESKAAAKALADSEQRLQLALDAAEMGSCDIDVNSGKGYWSRRHFLLLGYEPPADAAAPANTEMWLQSIYPEDKEAVLRALERARLEGSQFRSEHRVVRVDNGHLIWVNVQGRFICDAAGVACRFIGMISDVTERKNSEETLRRSEQRFRLMADSMPQIAWTAEPDGNIDYINEHFEVYTGIGRDDEEIRANLLEPERIIFDIVHPEDAERTAKAYEHAIRSGEIYQVENRIRGVDGSYRWHLSRAIPERDEVGRIIKWYGTATDINDLREMQEKLSASETKFRRIYESNLIAIFFWNKDGGITEANQAFCDLAGYSVEDCKTAQLSWLDVTPPELFERDFAAIEEIMARGICKPYEKVFINRKDGHRVSVLTAGAMMAGTDAEGIGFAVDLTDLKRTEEALKTSEATLKLAIETTGLGIFDVDLRPTSEAGEPRQEFWSDIVKRHFGLPADAEVDHNTFLSGVHPEDRGRVDKIVKDALKPGSSGMYSAEFRTTGIRDGKLRWLAMRGSVSFDANGAPVRMVGACLDITDIVLAEKALKEEVTERLRAVEELGKQEQLLIRQGRLAAMGEMIGNIAHQWRQPLNTLGLIVQELPRYYERDLFSKEYLDASTARAMQLINYMSKTIDGFRNFFGADKEKEAFKASEVLMKTVSIVETAFNELNLTIDVSADQEMVIYGYPNEFSQVILNILVNAKDALLERKVAKPRVVVRLFRENDKSVLTIADNAGGIDPEIQERIFDPYFTTKSPDKGTGIGLFMSKTIIEKSMNGTLTVRNTGAGAEFRIEV